LVLKGFAKANPFKYYIEPIAKPAGRFESLSIRKFRTLRGRKKKNQSSSWLFSFSQRRKTATPKFGKHCSLFFSNAIRHHAFCRFLGKKQVNWLKTQKVIANSLIQCIFEV